MSAPATQVVRPRGKAVADARARAALSGAELHELQGDDGRPTFIVTLGHITQPCSTLDDVDRCLASIKTEGTT